MKKSRQEKILEFITQYEIGTQEELTARLNEAGYKTTQATVSRDIKSMQLKKVPGKNGHKYDLPDQKTTDKAKYLRVFSDGLVRMDQAGNLVVIKTIAGMAMAVAAALDALDFEEIVGSIAGDDTIMCACKSDDTAFILIEKINQLLKDIQ